jgi:hypothetical protein
MSMSLPRQTLEKYLAAFFVETGTNAGDCVARAANVGFGRIISMEKSAPYAAFAKARFEGDDRITVLHGDSVDLLWDVIRDIDQPITFWLDSHYTPGLPLTATGRCPILDEVAIIGRHHIKTHTILVDDVACFSTPVLDNISVAQVQEAISEINPAYQFTFELGQRPGDVLAAVVKEAFRAQ